MFERLHHLLAQVRLGMAAARPDEKRDHHPDPRVPRTHADRMP